MQSPLSVSYSDRLSPLAGLSPPPSSDMVDLPPRRAIRAGRTDVLVVGGGPAGLGAALGASAAGARVVLAERYGFLGGNATAALVMPLTSFHRQIAAAAGGDPAGLYPTDHGEGEPIISGALRQLLDRMIKDGGAVEASPATGYTTPIDPESLKLAAYELLADSGVRMLLHSFASDMIMNPDSARVVFETKSGAVVIDADVVIDCTGDGDLAAAAGAAYQIGRVEDGLSQPMTLMFRMGRVNREGFRDYATTHPDQWKGVHGLWDLIREATQSGELDLPREDLLMFGTPHADEVVVNSTRVPGVFGTSVWDLTRAELVAHRQLQDIAAFLRRRVPGFENSYVTQSGVQIGVRETRRIEGMYQLTGDDVKEGRRFHDAIAHAAYPVDIHNPHGRGTQLERLPIGAFYDIPLRCLLPRDTDRLLVAGRCISGDHVAHSSYRVMPIAMATGHAAGVCGALAVTSGKRVADVPADLVQSELRRQGAILLEPTTTEYAVS